MTTESTLRLSLGDQVFEFVATPLAFRSHRLVELFAHKNNKTVGETVQHPRYTSLSQHVLSTYAGSVDMRLGEFVLQLKRAGDPFYSSFLNKHGDRAYCEFGLQDSSVARLKGLYCFVVGNDVKYIGRSTDTFGKRINQGYGRIHPKNCYRDGQSTNCHLNALIAEVCGEVRLHVSPLLDDRTIGTAESALIATYNPEWNVQLRTNAG